MVGVEVAVPRPLGLSFAFPLLKVDPPNFYTGAYLDVELIGHGIIAGNIAC
jgi:hypothetical protein